MASFTRSAGCLMLLLLCCAGRSYAQSINSTMAVLRKHYVQPCVPVSPGASFNGTSAVTQANATSTPHNSNHTSNGTMSETSCAASIVTQALDAVLGGVLLALSWGSSLFSIYNLEPHLLSGHNLSFAAAGASAAVGGVGQSATPVPTTAQTFSGASSLDALNVGGAGEPPDQVCLLQLGVIW